MTSGTGLARGRRGLAVALVTGAVGLLGVVGVPEAARAATDLSTVCPEGRVPPSGAGAGVHTPSVDCLAWYGIEVFPNLAFESSRAATRGELAALLVGLVDASDRAGAGTLDHGFGDIVGHPHEPAIARLHDLGVINGYDDAEFGPDDPVSRAQMAALLMRAGTQVHGLALPPLTTTLPFVDVPGSSTHHDNISRLARSGITQGVTVSRYDPGGQVTRGQAASFSIRLFALIVDDGGAAAKEPAPGPWRDLGTPEDPYYNEGTELSDRSAASLESFDYAGQPLCTEAMRDAVGIITIAENGILRWGMSKLDLQPFDGSTACVWTAPPGNDGAPTTYVLRRPASSWQPAASGCFVPDGLGTGQFAGVDDAWFCSASDEMRLELRISQHVYVVVSHGATPGFTPPMQGAPSWFWEHYTTVIDTGLVLEGRPTIDWMS